MKKEEMQKLLEEIYGESNVINVISLKTNETKGLKNSGVEKKFPKNKEYLIIACKDRNEYKFNINKIQKDDISQAIAIGTAFIENAKK